MDEVEEEVKPWQLFLSRAMDGIVSGDRTVDLSTKRTVDQGTRLLFYLLDEWMADRGNIAAILTDLFACLMDPEDEVVKTLDPASRQAVWGVLSMLRQEKKRRVKANAKTLADQSSAHGDHAPSGGHVS